MLSIFASLRTTSFLKDGSFHCLFLFVASACILLNACSAKKPYLKIGLVADPQYANKENSGKRNYKESLWKLEEAVKAFNENDVSFVQNLGDIIDVDWESFDSILPIYESLDHDINNYHVLGNHDFSIDSIYMTELLDKLSMPNYYYSKSESGWRFVALDATDYAFYSNPLHQHPMEAIDEYYLKSEGRPNHQLWNSAIGEEQQNWLKEELKQAKQMNQRVILFSHLPLRPEDDSHNLWNAEDMVRLLEGSDNVVAYINGHNHAGALEYHNGIYYITIAGMVDTMISSYGILEFYQDSLILRGFGNQESLHLSIK